MGIITEVILPLSLAFIMFSLGLGLTNSDFKKVATNPRDFFVGLTSQIIVLPIIAFILVKLWPISPELAVGVMIIASAPGGATSNILTSFAKGDKKSLKGLLEKNMFNRFSEVIDDRKSKQLKYETTFIGLKSSKVLEFKKIENIYRVTVNFVSEIITCVKDKNNQIIEGNPDTIKTVHDIWKFSKNMWSQDPTWYLVDTSNK